MHLINVLEEEHRVVLYFDSINRCGKMLQCGLMITCRLRLGCRLGWWVISGIDGRSAAILHFMSRAFAHALHRVIAIGKSALPYYSGVVMLFHIEWQVAIVIDVMHDIATSMCILSAVCSEGTWIACWPLIRKMVHLTKMIELWLMKHFDCKSMRVKGWRMKME